MRLAGEIKGGYYAAHPNAVEMVLARLTPSDPCLVFDPCAGEAKALLQLAAGLHAVPYAVELDEGRSETVRAAVPEGNAIAPADFLRCSITAGCFSFAWVNPPFDFVGGGLGRVESGFIEAAVPLLADKGVLALVCPEDIGRQHTMKFFAQRFDDVSIWPFPEDCRPYNEVVILGVKKKQPDARAYGWSLWDEAWEREIHYRLPPGRAPKKFCKDEPTDREVWRLMQASPLRQQLEPPAEFPIPRPPMSPGDGHRALLLASGHLNGTIHPPGEPPHVVRGCVSKEQYVASIHEDEDDKGNVTTRTTYSERIKLTIRTVDHQGVITNLTEE